MSDVNTPTPPPGSDPEGWKRLYQRKPFNPAEGQGKPPSASPPKKGTDSGTDYNVRRVGKGYTDS